VPAFQSANWCFTLNNPLSENEDDEPSSWDGVRYLVYQLEQGESETVHWQGYLTLEKKATLSAMKQLNSRAHWESRKGTHNQARGYCMKEPRLDGPYEIGTPPGKGGSGTAWQEIITSIKAGADDLTLMELNPHLYATCFRGITQIRTTLIPKRDWAMNIVVYWGPPGTGKTRAVKEACDATTAFWKDPGNKWFDGYCGQETIIFDDFKCNWFSLGVLVRLLDRYPMRVETKGGSIQFAPKTIYITSQCHPSEWYKESATAHESAAILRRITTINYLGVDEHIANRDAVMYVGYHDAPAPSNIL